MPYSVFSNAFPDVYESTFLPSPIVSLVKYSLSFTSIVFFVSEVSSLLIFESFASSCSDSESGYCFSISARNSSMAFFRSIPIILSISEPSLIPLSRKSSLIISIRWSIAFIPIFHCSVGFLLSCFAPSVFCADSGIILVSPLYVYANGFFTFSSFFFSISSFSSGFRASFKSFFSDDLETSSLSPQRGSSGYLTLSLSYPSSGLFLLLSECSFFQFSSTFLVLCSTSSFSSGINSQDFISFGRSTFIPSKLLPLLFSFAHSSCNFLVLFSTSTFSSGVNSQGLLSTVVFSISFGEYLPITLTGKSTPILCAARTLCRPSESKIYVPLYSYTLTILSG